MSRRDTPAAREPGRAVLPCPPSRRSSPGVSRALRCPAGLELLVWFTLIAAPATGSATPPASATGAADCGAALAGKPTLIRGQRHDLAWIAWPEAIPMDAHFALEFVVCPHAGHRLPRQVRVNATMPEHRHGMNYKPVVRGPRQGVWRAEGLLFHMGGKWEITFDLVEGKASERLASPVVVE